MKNSAFRPSPALMISCLSLFVALTGTAFAAGVLGKNSVHSAQIADGGVHAADLHDGAVGATKLGADAVGSGAIAANAVTADEIAENAVGSAEVAPDSLTAGDLGPDSVGAGEVQKGAVGASELGRLLTFGKGVEIAAGASGSVHVSCPPGDTVISGGAQTTITSTSVVILESVSNGDGWDVRALNTGAKAAGAAAIVNCLAPAA